MTGRASDRNGIGNPWDRPNLTGSGATPRPNLTGSGAAPWGLPEPSLGSGATPKRRTISYGVCPNLYSALVQTPSVYTNYYHLMKVSQNLFVTAPVRTITWGLPEPSRLWCNSQVMLTRYGDCPNFPRSGAIPICKTVSRPVV